MSVTKCFTKDPDAVLDYVWDWSMWLGPDVITSATVTAEPGVGAVVIQSQSHTETAVTAWVSGGTGGVSCLVTCRIGTLGGRTDERTAEFRVAER